MKNTKMYLINFIFIAALLAVISPLLAVSVYNMPSADDWVYGKGTHEVLLGGGNIFGVLTEAFKTAASNYRVWEGRFFNAFFAALQPGIFGEHFYKVVGFLMIGMLIFSEILFAFSLLGGGDKDKGLYMFPVVLCVLIMQIMYTPSIVESFYWYTGAVNYTFVYGLSLILFVLFLKLKGKALTKKKRVLLSIFAAILALMVGGDNFATSLSSVLVFFVFTAVLFVKDKRAFYSTLFIPILMTASMLLCIFAPGNMNRINGNFGGSTYGAFEAVMMSLSRTWLNIRIWTNVKVILVLIILLPFIWKIVKDMDFSFKLPGLFVLISFCIYSSQITATMYVDGTAGGGRMAAILYYAYWVFVTVNLGYVLGYMAKRVMLKKAVQKNDFINNISGKYIFVHCAVFGLILAALIYKNDLKELSSYAAYRDLRQGFAKQYMLEWDERLKILNDDSIKDVCFEPLSVCPETILYTDLQDEYGFLWVNEACADYYGKNSIIVLE